MRIPLFWRYLLSQFFPVFCILTLSLSSILFIARFQEIARFAADSSTVKATGLYLLCQLPYLLPFSLLIAAPLSAYRLGSSLSSTHELTAARLSGLSLSAVYAPLKHLFFWIALATAALTMLALPITKTMARRLVDTVDTNSSTALVSAFSRFPLKNTVFVLRNPSADSLEIGEVSAAHYDEETGAFTFFRGGDITPSNLDLIGENGILITKKEDSIAYEHSREFSVRMPQLNELLTAQIDEGKKSYSTIPSHLRIFLEAPSKDSKFFFSLGESLFFPLALFFLSEVAFYSSLHIGRKKRFLPTLLFSLSALLTTLAFLSGKSLERRPLEALLVFILPLLSLPLVSSYFKSRVNKGVAG